MHLLTTYKSNPLLLIHQHAPDISGFHDAESSCCHEAGDVAISVVHAHHLRHRVPNIPHDVLLYEDAHEDLTFVNMQICTPMMFSFMKMPMKI
jgi:hypothetical protein